LECGDGSPLSEAIGVAWFSTESKAEAAGRERETFDGWLVHGEHETARRVELPGLPIAPRLNVPTFRRVAPAAIQKL
jgi:hypothetical protein